MVLMVSVARVETLPSALITSAWMVKVETKSLRKNENLLVAPLTKRLEANKRV